MVYPSFVETTLRKAAYGSRPEKTAEKARYGDYR
jgi:hypothetical protein